MRRDISAVVAIPSDADGDVRHSISDHAVPLPEGVLHRQSATQRRVLEQQPPNHDSKADGRESKRA